MADYTITINCSIKGDFTYDYDPPCQQVRLNKDQDTVKWVCAKDIKRFALNFGWNTPFERGRYQLENKDIRPDFHRDVRHGQYKYSVSVLMKDGDIWTDDPDIIIEP